MRVLAILGWVWGLLLTTVIVAGAGLGGILAIPFYLLAVPYVLLSRRVLKYRSVTDSTLLGALLCIMFFPIIWGLTHVGGRQITPDPCRRYIGHDNSWKCVEAGHTKATQRGTGVYTDSVK